MEAKKPGQRQRSPEPAERVRDAERTKCNLLDAALTEFAAKGYEGARVSDIAARAGVNKQLISYYFGGKEGLYRAMQREWLDEESVETDPDVPPADVLRWYLHKNLSEPRVGRLSLWEALSSETPEEESQGDIDREQDWIRRRQERGEIASDLDPATVQLALMGMVLAPVVFPHTARRLFGLAIDDPEFETRYGDALTRILARLAEAAEHPAEHPTEKPTQDPTEHHPEGNPTS